MKNNTQKQNREHFRAPKNTLEILQAIRSNDIHFCEVAADLEDFGLYEGDVIAVNRKAPFTEDLLTVWDLENRERLLIGYAYENFGDVAVVNGVGELISFDKDRAKLVGVVVSVMREMCRSTPEVEISVVCSECGKSDKGTRKFLKSDGWKLKIERQLCVHCW